MRDLLVLKAQLERLVERLERMQAIPSSRVQTKRVVEIVRVGKTNAMAIHGLLDLVEAELASPEREQANSAADTESIDELIARVDALPRWPVIGLGALELDLEIVRIVPMEVAVKHRVIAFGRVYERGGTLQVAMVDPTNLYAIDDVTFLTGYKVEPYVASEDAIADAIKKYYPDPQPPDAA